MSTQYIPQPNGCANANVQRSNGLPKPSKSSPRQHGPPFEGETHGRAISGSAQHLDGHLMPKILLPRWHRLPLEGERDGVAANGHTRSSSRQSMPQKLACTPNKPNTLITVSIKLEKPHSSEILQVCLECTRWHANDMHRCRSGADASNSHMDGSHGKADVSRGRADIPGMLNHAETAILGHRDDLSTHLGARGAKHNVNEMDGLGSHADALGGHSDMPSIKTDTLIPTIAPAIIRMTRKRGKPPNLPAQSAKWLPDKPNGCGNHAGTSSVHTGSQNVETDVETARDEVEIISIRPIESKLWNPLTKGANGCANETNGSRSTPRTLNMHTHSITPANEAGTISMHQIGSKWPNSPSEATRQTLHESNAIGDHTDTPTVHTDAQAAQTRRTGPGAPHAC